MIRNKIEIQILQVATLDSVIHSINFHPKLTVISGPSNTGKSFILKCIEYVTGGKNPPKQIEDKEYDFIRLQIKSNESTFTIERSINSTTVKLFEGMISQIATLEFENLSISRTTKRRNLNDFLLDIFDSRGIEVKSNANNKKIPLTFRSIAHLFMIDETQIISEKSPITLGEFVNSTRYASLLKYMLIGIDDSKLETIESKDDVVVRSRGQEDILRTLINEVDSEILSVAESSPVSSNIIEERILNSLNDLKETQNEAKNLEFIRNNLWIELTKANSTLLYTNQLLNRFNLLVNHYKSDIKRLEFVKEGSEIFAQLVWIVCPLCNRSFSDHEQQDACAPIDSNADLLLESCEAEVLKIKKKSQDLEKAIESTMTESKNISISIEQITTRISALDENISNRYSPRIDSLSEKINDLKFKLTTSIRLQNLNDNRVKYLAILSSISNDSGTNNNINGEILFPELINPLSITLSRILAAWKFEPPALAEFEKSSMDFRINGSSRNTFGKGYRALTRAAFVIALMEYCISRGLPHPGFVILDSPLTTFKGQETNNYGEKVGEIIENAFFTYLSEIKYGQVIIIENKKPLKSISQSMLHIEFTKDLHLGRYGFF